MYFETLILFWQNFLQNNIKMNIIRNLSAQFSTALLGSYCADYYSVLPHWYDYRTCCTKSYCFPKMLLKLIRFDRFNTTLAFCELLNFENPLIPSKFMTIFILKGQLLSLNDNF